VRAYEVFREPFELRRDDDDERDLVDRLRWSLQEARLEIERLTVELTLLRVILGTRDYLSR